MKLWQNIKVWHNSMKAVILAAGMSRRMGMNFPKSILNINGETIIHRLVRQLLSNRIETIYIVVGWENHKIIKELDDFTNKIIFIHNYEYCSTNTAYSLWLSSKYIDESFIYIHADLVCHDAIIEKIINSCDANCCCTDLKPRYDNDAMKISVSDNKILELSKELPSELNRGTAIGIYKFDVTFFRKFIEEFEMNFEKYKNKYSTDVLNNIILNEQLNCCDISIFPHDDIDDQVDYCNVLQRISEVY